MSLSKSFLIAVVAVGALSTTACGKKKEDAKDMGAPLPPQQQQSPQPLPPTGPIKGPGDQGQVDRGPVQRGNGQGQQQGQGQGQSHDQQQVGQSDDGPKTPDVQNIQTSKRLTGEKNKDGLYYTGTGDDDTLAILQHNESQLSSEQQDINFKAAKSVKSVEVFQDIATREASASIKIDGEIYN